MVGDVVSQSAFEAGIPVNLRIVDHKTKRARIDTASYSSTNTFHVTNPAGVIDENVFRIIRKAMTQREALIIVDGEEDLLTIPTVLESPNESLVVYGQPNEGIVVITVTEIDKKQVRKLLDEMHHEE
jgi:uncharacterized protein (UPF0218 family)